MARRSRCRGESERSESTQQGATEGRVLRSRYLAVKSLIKGEREDISRADSDKFKSIISELESLHHLVQKPLEQVADAEALLDMTNTLVTSVKSHGSDGATPSDFVTLLLRNFGQQDPGPGDENSASLMSWADMGLAFSGVFNKASGCRTMLGPMNTQLKQRKASVHGKRDRPNKSTCPEEIDDTDAEERTDTDKNMSTMFDILRKKHSVKLENLVLNRCSFAQTVENMFALSFLVKDGRAEIMVDDNGHHIVSPRNAPAANALASGEVSFHHFVFRFDFKDWKLMVDHVQVGEELMPHRSQMSTSVNSQASPPATPIRNISTNCSQECVPKTPIRKLSRNRGLIIQEHGVNDTPDRDGTIRSSKRKCKRLIL